MKLSVWCPTRDPGPRVATLVSLLRPVADEIVIAVDSRIDPKTLGCYLECADRVLRFEYAEPMERVSSWLAAQCKGEWLLRFDGDEVPSTALIAAIPSLIANDRVYQYALTCRWLHPDGKTYLAEPPWNYSALRLTRNDPATFFHNGRPHGTPEAVFPSRYLADAAFYHLDAVLKPRSSREEKLQRRYLNAREELKPFGSDQDSVRYYVPEDFEEAMRVPVPKEDLELIERVLDATGPELPTPPDSHIPLFGRGEIDAHWAERTLSSTSYRAGLTVVDRDLRFAAGQHRPVHIRVQNRGDTTWPGGTRSPFIRISYRLLMADGGVVVAEGYRTDLPGPFGPGHHAIVPMTFAAPQNAGTYVLEADLVHEHVRWFDQSTRVPIIVK